MWLLLGARVLPRYEVAFQGHIKTRLSVGNQKYTDMTIRKYVT